MNPTPPPTDSHTAAQPESGGAARPPARSVAPLDAARLAYSVVLRQLVTRGRLIALAAVGAVVVIVSAAVGASEQDDAAESAVRVISDLGFTALVPIVALVFAAAALGDMNDDGTLVYLWLRPMDRWPIVLGAWAAAVTAAMPLTVIPLGLASLVANGGDGLVSATLIAAVVGVIAYSALFLLAGLYVRNAIAWGLGYILIWEGIVAAFGQTAGRLAIRGYTRSIITDRTGVDLDLGDLSLTAGIVVPIVIAVVALVLAARRLDTMDVA